MYIAKPTKQQMEWQDMEIGILIHTKFFYGPDNLPEQVDAETAELARSMMVAQAKRCSPKKLDTEQWMRSAAEMGAKYAVLVAKHGDGFALWDTKENAFSSTSMNWDGEKRDIVREFVDACKKYGIRPGLYYSVDCNGYYGIDGHKEWDYHCEQYQEYVKHAEAQVTELWTEYGELCEIWFDGGVIPYEKGGPNLTPILAKYQPNAICFQGPKDHPHNVRWVGNERGWAPENCWSTTNADEAAYGGDVEAEEAGIGDPNGKYFWPAESDVPNRTYRRPGGDHSGGWVYGGPSQQVLRPDELLEFYINSVGRNSNMLLGMTVTPDGEFPDEEQYRAFAKLREEHFGHPLASVSSPILTDNKYTIELPEKQAVRYVIIREDVTSGQLIRGYKVFADGKMIYEGNSLGHKRIIPCENLKAKEITLEITEKVGEAKIRDIAVC